MAKTKEKKTGIKDWMLWALLILVVLLVARMFGIEQRLDKFEVWLQDLGFLGYLFIVLAYMIFTLLAGPVLPLQLASGFAFGIVAGLITVTIAAFLAALVSFLVGRFLLHDFLTRRLTRWKGYERIEQVITTDGFKVVLLMRLNPFLPYGLQNYFLSITPVRIKDYLIATSFGTIPSSLIYVYLGSFGWDVLMEEGYTVTQWLLLAVGLAATAALVLLVSKTARTSLLRTGRLGRVLGGIEKVLITAIGLPRRIVDSHRERRLARKGKPRRRLPTSLPIDGPGMEPHRFDSSWNIELEERKDEG